jgi:hypothetical protein
MQVRSFCLLTFALQSLAALALPPAIHAASAVHGRRVRAAADCAGGSGCDDVDYAGIIRRWVEQGEASSRANSAARTWNERIRCVRTR